VRSEVFEGGILCILYFGCLNLFCNMWVCFDNFLGVLIICVLVFAVFCIVCTIFLYRFVYDNVFLFVLSVLVRIRTAATE
jgi:hypothetical protein